MFHGNPACVVTTTKWLDESVLLNIAKENAVAETAFLMYNQNKNDCNDYDYEIRWFTPDIEMDLCGHATLASGYVIIHILNSNNIHSIKFYSKASGNLEVVR